MIPYGTDDRPKASRGNSTWRGPALLLAGLLFWPEASLHAQEGASNPARNVGLDQRLGETVPLDLVFQDEEGGPIRLGEASQGRPLLLALVYYRCPMLCSLVLNGLLFSLRTLRLDAGRDFSVVAVSFDPREGAPLAAAKREEYVKKYARPGAVSGWRFLTGPEVSIDRLCRAVGFRYLYDPRTDQFAHAGGIVVLTPEGRISRYFFGIEFSPRDLGMSLAEASKGKVGTLADRLLLLCFHYDPATGRYGPSVLRILQASGLLTTLAVGLFIGVMIRRERRRSRNSPTGQDSRGPIAATFHSRRDT